MRKFTWYVEYSDGHGGDDIMMEDQPDFQTEGSAYFWLVRTIKHPLKGLPADFKPTGFRLKTADAYFNVDGVPLT